MFPIVFPMIFQYINVMKSHSLLKALCVFKLRIPIVEMPETMPLDPFFLRKHLFGVVGLKSRGVGGQLSPENGRNMKEHGENLEEILESLLLRIHNLGFTLIFLAGSNGSHGEVFVS